MRIAFVTAYPPSRIRTRSFSLLRELAREHEVTSVCTFASEQDVRDLDALRALGIRILAVRSARVDAVARAGRALLTGEALQVAYGAHPGVRNVLRELVATQQVDVVHFEHLRGAAFALDLALDVAAPVVWDSVDCISQVYAAGAKSGATPIMRWLGRVEARRTRRAECALLAALPHVVVAAARDRDALLDEATMPATLVDKHRPLAAVHVIPNGVDTAYFAYSADPRPENVIVFSGTMSYHANVAAALLLYQRIMPIVWSERPDVRLVLAGSNPSSAIQALARDSRVTVTGYVPDLRPFIAGATIAVSPTPYAFGIQNKVMEALAIGTPVVASSSSIGGLGPIPEDIVRVADAPEDFAQAVLRLLADPSLREWMSHAGRAYVETQYSWRTSAQRLVSVFEAAIAAYVERGPASTSRAEAT